MNLTRQKEETVGSAVLANKFKVGDEVIGNYLADKHYSFTRHGWIGEVIISGSNYIVVQSACYDGGPRYTVQPEHFDLLKRENKLVDKMRRL